MVAWLNADFTLMLKLLESWAEEIERELDFRVRGEKREGEGRGWEKACVSGVCGIELGGYLFVCACVGLSWGVESGESESDFRARAV